MVYQTATGNESSSATARAAPGPRRTSGRARRAMQSFAEEWESAEERREKRDIRAAMANSLKEQHLMSSMEAIEEAATITRFGPAPSRTTRLRDGKATNFSADQPVSSDTCATAALAASRTWTRWCSPC